MTITDREPSAALAAALAAVQAELPDVKKTRTANVENKEGRFLYSYAYADLADASAAILPILGKHGLAFTAFPGHRADGKFGLRYWLLHSDGGSIEGFFEIPDQGGMQLVGGRITYARRYCLCAVTGIAADEDVDARDDGGPRRPRRQADGDGQPPQRTAQRKQRDGGPPAAPQGASRPPLPGEAPPPVADDGGAAVTNRQLTAIWTSLTKDFSFDDSEKDQARMVCGAIIGREVASTRDLTRAEGGKILDTLGTWKQAAEREGDEKRAYLIAALTAAETAREQDDAAEERRAQDSAAEAGDSEASGE